MDKREISFTPIGVGLALVSMFAGGLPPWAQVCGFIAGLGLIAFGFWPRIVQFGPLRNFVDQSKSEFSPAEKDDKLVPLKEAGQWLYENSPAVRDAIRDGKLIVGMEASEYLQSMFEEIHNERISQLWGRIGDGLALTPIPHEEVNAPDDYIDWHINEEDLIKVKAFFEDFEDSSEQRS